MRSLTALSSLLTIALIATHCAKTASAADEAYKLWYKSPGERFEECLPLGNGTLGAAFNGGCPTERVLLNHITLWSGEPFDPSMNPTAHQHVPAVRKALFAGKYQEADRLVRAIQGKFSESFAPLGELAIQWNHSPEVTNYRRELDLTTATASVSYQVDGIGHAREMFVSHPDQAVVMRFTAEKAGALNFSLAASSKLRSSCSVDAGVLKLSGRAPYHAEPNYRKSDDPILYADDRGTRFCALVQVVKTDGKVQQDAESLRVSDATTAVVVVTMATSFDQFDRKPMLPEDAIARAALDRLSDTSWDELRKAHLDDYQKLYERMTLQLEGSTAQQRDLPTDERLRAYSAGARDPEFDALYFQYGRYLLISSSRTPKVPANLQGLWNPYMRPPWSSNYTANINVQMNYWPAEVTNLSQLHEPLLGFIENVAMTGRTTAREFFGCDGWTCCHNTDIWAMSNPVGDFGNGHPVWANWCMGGSWFSAHLWEHYLFTQDRAYLRERAYPLMRGAAEFCLDWLTEGQGGVLVTAPSTSPENLYRTDAGYVGSASIMATSDLAMIIELFNSTRQAAEILGVDEDFRQEIVAATKKLPPYRVGSKGQLLEWYLDWEDYDPHHRHVSHLYGLFPGTHLSLAATPALSEAIKQSLELRGDGGSGWSRAWKISLWARLHEGDRAHKLLRSHLHCVDPLEGIDPRGEIDYSRVGTLPNLWDCHPPFQIDGNFGGTAGIAEMLTQSTVDSITLLPALPSEWPSGRVAGLCARGGFVVQFQWSAGRLVSASVASKRGGTTTVRYGEHQLTVDVPAGGETKLKIGPAGELLRAG